MFHGKITEAEASTESSLKELARKFSKLATYADYELCHGCFSRDFLRIFKIAFPKNTSDKILLSKDIIIIVSFILQAIQI